MHFGSERPVREETKYPTTAPTTGHSNQIMFTTPGSVACASVRNLSLA